MLPQSPQDRKTEPANPRLWAMVVAQAKAKFAVYPSPAAAHWVHSEYEKKGGQFVAPQGRRRRGH